MLVLVVGERGTVFLALPLCCRTGLFDGGAIIGPSKGLVEHDSRRAEWAMVGGEGRAREKS